MLGAGAEREAVLESLAIADAKRRIERSGVFIHAMIFGWIY
jgi:hypothetical protein